jgi:hypothetical protein
MQTRTVIRRNDESRVGPYDTVRLLDFNVPAQNAPTATLVDEIGKTGCENLSARIQAFYQTQLKSNPGSVGYVVIYPRQGELRQFSYESLIRGQIKMWRFDPSLLNVVRGKDSPDPKIEFWIVPPGSTKPDFQEGKWVYAIKRSTKYYSVFEDGGLCTSDNEGTYLSILRDNPDLRGNIVIWERSAMKYEKERIRFQTDLHEISPSRLRFFRGRCSNGRCDGFELWLVPNK